MWFTLQSLEHQHGYGHSIKHVKHKDSSTECRQVEYKSFRDTNTKEFIDAENITFINDQIDNLTFTETMQLYLNNLEEV